MRNVTTGQRLDTIDGLGSCRAHYGAGSGSNQNQIELSDFSASFTADFDMDGDVDSDDLGIWQTAYGAGNGADGDNDSDRRDFLAWQRQFGSAPIVAVSTAVPEPTFLGFFCLLPILCLARMGQKHSFSWPA